MQYGGHHFLVTRNKCLYMIITLISVSSLILVRAISRTGTIVFAAKFKATMTGNSELPGVVKYVNGYTSFRTASNDTNIKYKVNVKGLSDATGAHIHEGRKAQNGEIIVGLLSNSKKNKTRCGMSIRGNISDSDLIGLLKWETLDYLLSAIKNGITYINIHTPDHPNGEISRHIESSNNIIMNESNTINNNLMVNG